MSPLPWLYGFLDLCLLCLLHEADDYGYGLIQRLEALGFGELPGGTIYPALLRLERQGLVTTRWQVSTSGPRRKYYSPTASGTALMTASIGEWAGFRDSVDRTVALASGLPATPHERDVAR